MWSSSSLSSFLATRIERVLIDFFGEFEFIADSFVSLLHEEVEIDSALGGPKRCGFFMPTQELLEGKFLLAACRTWKTRPPKIACIALLFSGRHRCRAKKSLSGVKSLSPTD